MLVHKHHTPFVGTMSQPTTQNHRTLRKATNQHPHFATIMSFDYIAEDALPIDITPVDVAPP